MSAPLPSLAEQAERWCHLNASPEAGHARHLARTLVEFCREHGLCVEIVQVSHACSMGATHEEITVTPSRDGYQSTT